MYPQGEKMKKRRTNPAQAYELTISDTACFCRQTGKF